MLPTPIPTPIPTSLYIDDPLTHKSMLLSLVTSIPSDSATAETSGREHSTHDSKHILGEWSHLRGEPPLLTDFVLGSFDIDHSSKRGLARSRLPFSLLRSRPAVHCHLLRPVLLRLQTRQHPVHRRQDADGTDQPLRRGPRPGKVDGGVSLASWSATTNRLPCPLRNPTASQLDRVRLVQVSTMQTINFALLCFDARCYRNVSGDN